MELKKNPKLELKKNSLLYFSIGMTTVLLLAYVALEWKTFYETPEFAQNLDMPDDIDDVLPPVIINLPPPPPPKIQTPPVIEIVDDEKDIIETVIESNDINQDTEVVDVDEVIVDEIEEDITVIIDLIDEAPIFPGCESEVDKKACFQKMMTKHVNRNIRYPDIAQELNIQGRVSTQFIIGKDGTIKNLKMRGPHKVLEQEAARIISKLPQMVPGKQKGKTVKVAFSLPITFKMQ